MSCTSSAASLSKLSISMPAEGLKEKKETKSHPAKSLTEPSSPRGVSDRMQGISKEFLLEISSELLKKALNKRDVGLQLSRDCNELIDSSQLRYAADQLNATKKKDILAKKSFNTQLAFQVYEKTSDVCHAPRQRKIYKRAKHRKFKADAQYQKALKERKAQRSIVADLEFKGQVIQIKVARHTELASKILSLHAKIPHAFSLTERLAIYQELSKLQ